MSEQKAWAKIEKELVASSPQDYYVKWGAARQAFYAESGPLPLLESDRARLRGLKNAFWGETIFILGNGPSLNKTDLNLLKDKYTFCVNRAYLLYERINWKPTFYTANDWRVVPDNCAEMNALTGSMFFFDNNFKGIMREDEDTYFYEHTAGDPSDLPERVFSSDMSKGVRGAGSVVGTAIQIAAHLGFKVINLIGCDLGYNVRATVTQSGEDKFGNGVKLELTSTKDDDPNHFDPRYFGKGRRWHDPNVKRMISGHEQCLKGTKNLGISLRNATIGGDLELYERVDFKDAVQQSPNRDAQKMSSLLVGPLFSGPFPRAQFASVDESEAIHNFFKMTNLKCNQMIDVGAHHGSSLMRFAQSGTKVLAFEPDPQNRSFLLKNLTRNDAEIDHKVVVVPKAVSNYKAKAIPFFSSPESSGVSGLSNFLSSHEVVEHVGVTTLSDMLEEAPTDPIDFLKIDVEGHELKVLQGLKSGYDHIKCIVAEYEDEKSLVNGFTTQDMAQFLTEKGFTIYVSEWWPIVRYGVPHSFKQFYRLDQNSAAPKEGWGNIIAIRNDYAEQYEKQLLRAFNQALLEKTSAATANAIKKGAPPQADKTAPSAKPANEKNVVSAQVFPDIVVNDKAWLKKTAQWGFKKRSKFDLVCVFKADSFPKTNEYSKTSPSMLGVISGIGIYLNRSGAMLFARDGTTLFRINDVEIGKAYRLIFAFSDNTLTVALSGKTLFKIADFAASNKNELMIGNGYLERSFSGRIGTLVLKNHGRNRDLWEAKK